MGLSCFKAAPEPAEGTAPADGTTGAGEFESASATSSQPTDSAETFKKAGTAKPAKADAPPKGEGAAVAGAAAAASAAAAGGGETAAASGVSEGEDAKVLRERRAESIAAVGDVPKPQLHEPSSPNFKPAFSAGVKRACEATFHVEVEDDGVVETFNADSHVART
jgi:hypothetical protein